MSKGTDLVKAIGDKIIGELEKLDEDYNIEYDEFGLYSASYGISINYEYGNSQCDIECSVSWPGGNIEVTVYGVEGIHEKRYKNLDRIQDALQDYLDSNLDTDDLLSNIEDDYRDACADEWEEHGFRDAADYYHYRYG